MIALIGAILSSIFRGKEVEAIALLGIIEICLVDWWLLPLLISKWKS